MNTTATTQTAERLATRVPTGTWQVVQADSELGFSTRILFGLIPVKGIYSRYKGELLVDDEGNASGSLQVEAATISTGIKKRDAHLRSEDFFAAEAHPLVRFELGEVRAGADGSGTLTGTLHIREVELPIQTPVSIAQHGPDGLRIDASFPVDHGASSLGWKKVPATVQVHAALALERAR